jgi:hypothetical protein
MSVAFSLFLNIPGTTSLSRQQKLTIITKIFVKSFHFLQNVPVIVFANYFARAKSFSRKISQKLRQFSLLIANKVVFFSTLLGGCKCWRKFFFLLSAHSCHAI